MASEHTLDEKIKILKEKELSKKTIVELCAEHSISVPTYYVWKKEIEAVRNASNGLILEKGKDVSLKDKYNNLKSLYISLSEHNYQLAQFLK